MFLLTYLAHPMPESDDWESVQGAFINAWIDQPSMQLADQVASKWITGFCWVIENLEEWHEVTHENYENDDPNFEYYKQALIDKEVYVYNTWPHGGDDDQIIH